jgi:hypothetical protein
MLPDFRATLSKLSLIMFLAGMSLGMVVSHRTIFSNLLD